MPFIVPADQGHVPLHPYSVLSSGRGSVGVVQHGWR